MKINALNKLIKDKESMTKSIAIILIIAALMFVIISSTVLIAENESNETNQTNQTYECLVNEDCNDNESITIDICHNNQCHHEFGEINPINEINETNQTEPPVVEPECLTDEDCDDDNESTIDLCIEGNCSYQEIEPPQNQTNETNLTEFTLVIEDYDGDKIYSQVSVYNKSEGRWVRINGKIDLEQGEHEVKIKLTQDSIKNIGLSSLEVKKETKEYKLKIDANVPLEKGFENSVQVYAIDPTELNFINATVTTTAQGSELYKCREWNFKKRECTGEWVKLMDIIPGENYDILLTPEDPAYSETFQPNGTDGIDTFVNQNAPNQNYGNQTFLAAAESSGNYADILIKFTGNIPQGANITSAKLKLYFYNSPTNATNAINLSARLITENWSEQTVTWNTRPNYTTSYSDKVTLTNNYGWVVWDVTEGVQRWVNGSNANYGIAVLPDAVTANTDKRFYSSDSSNASLRPILEVNYTTGEAPNITLIWPENASQHGDGDVWLGYRVESNESIANCSLIANETIYGTDNNIQTGTLQRQKLTVNNNNF